jgi:hypothetical protein
VDEHAAWNTLGRNAADLARTDAGLIEAIGELNLDEIEARLHDRSRLIEAMAIAADAARTGGRLGSDVLGIREPVVEGLRAAAEQAAALVDAMDQALQESRSSLSCVRAGRTLTRHASSVRQDRRGGWCDVRR